MNGERLGFQSVLILAFVFGATRAVLHLSSPPYFDPDSYKYLAVADALRGGQSLPPLYTDVYVNGGALHAVPGYGYLIYVIWVFTGAHIQSIALVNSVISFLGYLALAHLLSHWISRATGILTFAVVALSPSVAWLEHTIMPDGIAAPLLMIAFCAAATGATANPRRIARFGGAAVSGLILGFQVLMRTSSQVYLPLPWLLATKRRAGVIQIGAWTVLYLAVAIAPLAPWLLHNHEKHGVWAASVSTGRNFYFNAIYSGTLEIGEELKRYGMVRAPAVPHSAYALSDRALQSEIAKGLSLVEADRKLGEVTVEAYRQTKPSRLAEQRLSMVLHLFVRSNDPGAGTLTPLRPYLGWYLTNYSASTQVRTMLEKRFRHRFSPEFVAAMEQTPEPHRAARAVWEAWVRHLSFDGLPLLIAYGLAAVAILLRRERRGSLLVTLVAPPALFLVIFAFFQAPIYRYQAGLHAFMLATVVAGLVVLMGRVRGGLPHGLRRAGVLSDAQPRPT